MNRKGRGAFVIRNAQEEETRLLKRLAVVFLVLALVVPLSGQVCAEETFSRRMLYKLQMNRNGTEQVLFKLNLYASVPDDLTLQRKEEYRAEVGRKLDDAIEAFVRLDGWTTKRPIVQDEFSLVDLSIEFELKGGPRHSDLWTYNYVREPDRLFAQEKFRERNETWVKFLEGLVTETREALQRKYDLR